MILHCTGRVCVASVRAEQLFFSSYSSGRLYLCDQIIRFWFENFNENVVVFTQPTVRCKNDALIVNSREGRGWAADKCRSRIRVIDVSVLWF